ncbi:hypothetical protein QJ857_gp0914 [Tupanvirus soda lake]|uniref:Transmembrane protein n=2 Tax=Tupanvirus TaxID=2094720 RepID=A0A6N1NUD6_9VIRU|nr:hypothetical protein QJ857_gp0914 [Tupanvirus soda lake]QKU35138.1 hypothetical protein [Tupanvirus soda lake]
MNHNNNNSDESKSFVFLYIVIIVVCLFVSKFFNITLSTILFLVIAAIIIFYIHNNVFINKDGENKYNDTNNKLETIHPKPKNIDNYPNFINFIHNMQKYNQYNVDAFDGVINSIDQFVGSYEKIINEPSIYCEQDLLTAINFARNAQNYLQSMIYKIPTDFVSTDELHKHMKDLDTILNNYIYQLNTLCGDTGNISFHGPKPYNFYDNSKWNQFEFY